MSKVIKILILLITLYSLNQAQASDFDETLITIETRKTAMQGIWERVKRLSPYVELKEKVDYNKELAVVDAQEIEKLLESEVKKVNDSVPKKQQIKKFVLLYKEFDADDDELTRTKKLRRNFVISKYNEIVEAIYNQQKSIKIDAVINLQDGGTQKIKTELNIINME